MDTTTTRVRVAREHGRMIEVIWEDERGRMLAMAHERVRGGSWRMTRYIEAGGEMVVFDDYVVPGASSAVMVGFDWATEG